MFALATAGSEVVRITVNRRKPQLRWLPSARDWTKLHCNVPLVGDFHFNGQIAARLP